MNNLNTDNTNGADCTIYNKKAIIIDGRKLATKISDEIKDKVKELKEKPCLAFILVGDDPASKVYVNIKTIQCERLGILSKKIRFDTSIKEEDLLEKINELNNDENVHGILVQLPLPKHLNENKITSSIDVKKDVDGFHHENLGKLFTKNKSFRPCTALAIIELIKSIGYEIKGKSAVIIGRSIVVGKPVSLLLLENDATVTICHSKTENLQRYTKEADILVVACGMPKMIKEDMIKKGAVVIDVGINKLVDLSKEKGYSLVGDVDFENVVNKASYITPVPGGVGPMTVAMLMKNTLKAYELLKINTKSVKKSKNI